MALWQRKTNDTCLWQRHKNVLLLRQTGLHCAIFNKAKNKERDNAINVKDDDEFAFATQYKAIQRAFANES